LRKLVLMQKKHTEYDYKNSPKAPYGKEDSHVMTAQVHERLSME
jgi:deferrochelatase/peroxidase EfeB